MMAMLGNWEADKARLPVVDQSRGSYLDVSQ